MIQNLRPGNKKINPIRSKYVSVPSMLSLLQGKAFDMIRNKNKSKKVLQVLFSLSTLDSPKALGEKIHLLNQSNTA